MEGTQIFAGMVASNRLSFLLQILALASLEPSKEMKEKNANEMVLRPDLDEQLTPLLLAVSSTDGLCSDMNVNTPGFSIRVNRVFPISVNDLTGETVRKETD